MKFSIAVLSSILAVCSVTTAGPVYPSSATNAEASTSTDGSDYPVFPTKDGLKKYCSPFDDIEVPLITGIAKSQARLDKMLERLEGVRHKVNVQRKVTFEAEQKVESLEQTPSQLLDNAKEESDLHQKKLRELEQDLEERVRRASDLIKEEDNFKETLMQNLLDRSLMASNSLLRAVPGYSKCFHYFFDYFMEKLI
ncbi:hypothetical protein BATDEDRAFT_24376 [Batrachochytrium dendrobatidis JAM81]|uniref:Uncharacterized protein n=1 Tax=Batrachochytrium dendrobatidis (strain JAM81 / FGSC 10211) TaxID=684364 RepID=F4P1D3_BATDJ|nr:uncharacterized protein BATDEDRAFT_24376 [Batrachochytrium dendrobatidis JAM81]EGF80615.1 hypothetical protein BATDEDRAFT_24376 [Batrachochytrium dendrobatidis JAM81]|eukprot:XP_006678432.1 hypothetical protein BATDEDRAFT_24376 [Batrachochytrium dendrobatidis JAM81]